MVHSPLLAQIQVTYGNGAFKKHLSTPPPPPCFSQAPTLRPCYPPSGIVSIVAIPGWVAAHCGVAGYPIIHSQGHIGRKGWEMEGWRGGQMESLHPAARTWSSGDDTTLVKEEETQLVKKRKRFQVVNDAITNATDRAHTHLLFRFSHGSCAVTSAAKQDEHARKWLPLNAAYRFLIFETVIKMPLIKDKKYFKCFK